MPLNHKRTILLRPHQCLLLQLVQDSQHPPVFNLLIVRVHCSPCLEVLRHQVQQILVQTTIKYHHILLYLLRILLLHRLISVHERCLLGTKLKEKFCWSNLCLGEYSHQLPSVPVVEISNVFCVDARRSLFFFCSVLFCFVSLLRQTLWSFFQCNFRRCFTHPRIPPLLRF